MRKSLHVEVYNGLCNRLRVLTSAMCLAEDLDRDLVIYWPSSKPECQAPFSVLFETGSLPKWVTVKDQVIRFRKAICFTPAQALQMARRNEPIFSQAYLHKSDLNRRDLYFRNLLPQPSILRQVRNNFLAKPGHLIPIGVHIRRTDHTSSITHSPLGRFELAMDKYPNGFFYLATDSEYIFKELRRKFGSRLFSHERLRNRTSEEGIKEAVVSLYTLAFCSSILGSYKSSFSLTAAKLKPTRIEIISN
jgi:hypothetical protein